MSPSDWPELNNYFSFYGLEPVYPLDEVLLKQLFLAKSKQFHPDFFGDDLNNQFKAIEVTAFNNKAFRVLSQPLERIRYIIQLNIPEVNEESKLSNDFLMEMLDINEQIDEFEFSENKKTLKHQIEVEINKNIISLTTLLIDLINDKQWTSANSELLKVNYLQRLTSRLLVKD